MSGRHQDQIGNCQKLDSVKRANNCERSSTRNTKFGGRILNQRGSMIKTMALPLLNLMIEKIDGQYFEGPANETY